LSAGEIQNRNGEIVNLPSVIHISHRCLCLSKRNFPRPELLAKLEAVRIVSINCFKITHRSPFLELFFESSDLCCLFNNLLRWNVE